MEEYQNSDPNLANIPDSQRLSALGSGRKSRGSPPSGRSYLPDPDSVGGRVEANTAFLKIGHNMTDVSGFESVPEIDGKSGITPADDDEGGEATSARIAQEYRRQVRIKRLGEEIQQAEREKRREEEARRKTETQMKASTNIRKKKEETARFGETETLSISPETESTIAKKRAEAMNAFKTASTTNKRRSGLLTVLFGLLVLGALMGGGWVGLDWMATQRKKQTQDEVVQHTQVVSLAEQKILQDIKIQKEREAELVRQKLAAEEKAKRAEAEKYALQEAMRETEAQKAQLESAAKRAAEELRIRTENDKIAEEARQEKAAFLKKIELERLAAQERSKKKMEDEARAEAAKMANEPPKPAPQPKPDVPLTGDVKTIPADPPVVTDKLELPSGGVRLFVKASDPYGGKLTFQWKQLKGSQVEIADPNAAKFLDGKWISQTYFVAKQPGTYEFEVTVKNDEGVASTKKFPIEVLPPTTLK